MKPFNFAVFVVVALHTTLYEANALVSQQQKYPSAYLRTHKHQSPLLTNQRPTNQKRSISLLQTTSSSREEPKNEPTKDGPSQYTLMERLAVSISQRAAVNSAGNTFKMVYTPAEARALQVFTFLRVSVPSVISGIVATLVFPALSLFLCTMMNSAGVFTVLSTDSSQFVQNFLTVAGLLFSILVGQTYYFMYQQQENLYYALFNEVTEAKSLLEQVALVCQGRSMYRRCLESISKYVNNDLKQLQADPAVLLSARPSEDPLESIMYMTSVGVPSTVYETVRSLRQARASRLGALQRKIPQAHMWLLWVLASLELVSFPLLGAGTQAIGGYNILTVEGVLFGVMTAGIVLTLRVVGELWRPAGGAYNVDSVLTTMVMGLEEELDARMAGKTVFAASRSSPSSAREIEIPVMQAENSKPEVKLSERINQQGGNILDGVHVVYSFVRRFIRR